MISKIIDREEIKSTSLQQKMIRSGWGDECIDNSVVESITYLSDGLKVKGYLAYPKDQTKKYPCVIWCRGGYGDTGIINNFNALGIFGQLASRGYIVFATQYRGNAGGDGIDEFGGSDVNDVLNLIPLADELECADKNTWGIEGWSRGGMMTYLSLTRTNIFKAAIVICGIADLKCNAAKSEFKNYLEEVLHDKVNNHFLDYCKERSIINFPEKLSKATPILLIHGTNDERVSPDDSKKVHQRLLELNIPGKLIMLEGGDHYLKSRKKEVDELRKDWFSKHLK